MVFYFYDILNWSTIRFGVVVGAYGLAMVVGQAGLGQLSDRFGRKPIILVGLGLTSMLYLGLASFSTYGLMILIALFSGLGAALTGPALSAFVLDITREKSRSQVVGIKESALALGGVLGPLTVAGISGLVTARSIFLIAGGLILTGLVIALLILKEPDREAIGDLEPLDLVVSERRSLAAQASLRGVVIRAVSARGTQ